MKNSIAILFFLFFAIAVSGQIVESLIYAESSNLKNDYERITENIDIAAISDGEKFIFKWSTESFYAFQDIQKKGVIITKIWTVNNIQNIQTDTVRLKSNKEWRNTTFDDFGFKTTKNIYLKGFTIPTTKNALESYRAQTNIYSTLEYLANISNESAYFQGMGFIDSLVQKGINYKYILSFKDKNNKTIQTSISINTDDTKPLLELDSIQITPHDKYVLFAWDKSKYENSYIAYIIEKLDNTSGEYKSVSDVPFIFLTNENKGLQSNKIQFKDSLKVNGELFKYRIKGIDFFGRHGPYSEPLNVIGKFPPLTATAEIFNIFETSEQAFEINWFLNEKYNNQILGFYILRSIDGKKSYEKLSTLLNPEERQFLDESPSDINFYKIVIIDSHNNEIHSTASLGQLTDNTPPKAPTGLTGEIDTLGNVSLSWEENSDADLFGYHVFTSNGKNSEYSILSNDSPIFETQFRDSIYNTLAQKIYYKILAIDYRGNQSKFSEILELKRPDLNPPVKSIFKTKRSYKGYVEISWTNSASQDVTKNELQRSHENSNWETLSQNSESGTTVSFIDSTLDCNKKYQYRILSFDNTHVTISDTINMKCIDSGKRTGIKDLKVQQIDKKINLEFSYPISSPITSILIYRKEKKGDFRKIKQFWANEITNQSDFKYTDNKVVKKSSYQYMVVLRFEDKGFAKSPVSKPIKIK